jgi:hypothetical protein
MDGRGGWGNVPAAHEPAPLNRILHFYGDSFFASREIAFQPALEGRPVWSAAHLISFSAIGAAYW